MLKIFASLILALSLISFFLPLCPAGQLGNYPNVSSLASGDQIPVVIVLTNVNRNVNWYELRQLMSSGLNWTDIKTVATQYGDHSGINWQAFGA